MSERAPLEAAENAARNLGRVLKNNLPVGFGFVIVLSSYGDGGVSTYLSSIERDGCVKLLREMADHIESKEASI